MATASDYTAEVANALKALERYLLEAGDVDQTARARAIYKAKNDEWTKTPAVVLRRYRGKSLSDALSLWQGRAVQIADQLNRWDKTKQWDLRQKMLAQVVALKPQGIGRLWFVYSRIVRPQIISAFGRTPQTASYLTLLQTTFAAWYLAQPVTTDIILLPPETALLNFWLQRREILVALVTTHAPRHPKDPDSQAADDSLEVQLSLVPTLGPVFDLYRGWQARLILTYQNRQISETERALLSLTPLLDVAGRLVKAGRLMYTSARLVLVFGGNEPAWKRAIAYAALLANDMLARKALDDGIDSMQSKGSLTKLLAADASKRFGPLLTADAKNGIFHEPQPLEGAVDSLWKSLGSTQLIWLGQPPANLDPHALRRILAMGPSMPLMRCQLLAELVESYIGVVVRQKLGAYALGITVPSGCILEFIPGHAVTVPFDPATMRAQQVSDGLLGYYINDVFIIAAVLVIKFAGTGGRDLTFTNPKLSGLTRDETALLRSFANREWASAKEASERTGLTFKREVDDYLTEILASEIGPQIHRDLDRLMKLKQLQLSGVKTNFTLLTDPSKVTTKFFVVVPKRGDASVPTAELASENKSRSTSFGIEPLAVPVDAASLEQTQDLLQEARKLVYPEPTPTPSSPDDFVKYVEHIYDLAIKYFSGLSPDQLENAVSGADRAVTQWLRSPDYHSAAFDAAIGKLDQDWLNFVKATKPTIISWVRDPKQPANIKVSHFGASLEGVLLFGATFRQSAADKLGASMDVGDILGWAGDLVTFYVDWQVENRKTTISGFDFCHQRLAQPAYKKEFETSMKLRDVIEDADAYNIGTAINASRKRTIVDEVRALFRPGGGYTDRFRRFLKGRLGGNAISAAKAANVLLTTTGLFSITEKGRDAVLGQANKGRKQPIPSPTTLSAADINSFCQGFGEVMEELAATG